MSDITKDSLIALILYFKRYTAKKNSGINDTLEFLFRIFRYFNVYVDLPKFNRLPDDTKSFKTIQDNDLEKILRYVRSLDEVVGNNLIYKLIVFLFLDSGCRASELLNIEISNIDMASQSILLEQTKNGKPRYVYFSLLSESIIKKAIKRSNSIYLFNDLFKGKQAKYRMISYFLGKMKLELKLNKLHAHQFRKTFATNLLKNGAGLEVIQKLLGHTDIKMTMLYLNVYDFYVLEEYKKYQPKY